MNNVFGKIPDLFETDFEQETSKAAGSIFDAIKSLTQDIAGTESEDEKNEKQFPIKGSIEFKKSNDEKERKLKADIKIREAFFAALKEDQQRAKEAKDKLLFEEEIWDIITNLPTEQKNKMLHYQASYKDRSIYQRAALRRKIIEEKNKQEKKEKQATIPNPAKRPNALETAFEGGSGKQGAGSANLSNQAVG